MARFDHKVFLLSGGARGLGEAQARQLVAEGARVVIGDVLEEQGRKLAAELGPHCVFQPLDVSSEAQWSAAVATAESIGARSGLVKNAGIFEPRPIEESDVAHFERSCRVNQLGTFLGMRAVVGAFERSGGGAIVNISSTAGLRGVPNAIAYTATKWAVRGMTKAAALELAARNIRVNSVHPGPINTDMLVGRPEDAAQNEHRRLRVPMKRFGEKEEIARLVLFLLSDDSRYMTGSEVAMDGGISL